MSNRTTVKSNILTLNVPIVTNAILTEMLNDELADNLVFKEDVAVLQTSTTSNINLDFTDKDRIDLTRTGGVLNITLSGIEDGEVKYLLITKTSGQAVTFVGVTDVTPVPENANAQSKVLYEIVRKSTSYYAKAWVKSPITATDTREGVLETGTVAECNSLSATNKIVTPGRIPLSTSSQKGLIEIATEAETNHLTDTSRAVVPANIPKMGTSQMGIAKQATAYEIELGKDNYYSDVYVVPPSQLKIFTDSLYRTSLVAQALIVGSTTYGYLTLYRIGKCVTGIFNVSGVKVGFSLATYTLTANLRPIAGVNCGVRSPLTGDVNTICINSDGTIYILIDTIDVAESLKNIGISYVTA